MRLFQNRQFVSGASVVGVLMLAQNGVIFTLPVFLQGVKELDAFHTGLTLLPMSLMLLIVSPAAAHLTRRIPHKRLVQTGLIVNTIAIFAMRYEIGIDMKLTALIPGLALYGIGMGLVLSQINNLTLSAVEIREAGEASGVMNTFRQIGISLGAAIIGAILISTILLRLETTVAKSASIPQQTKSAIAHLLVQQASGLAFGESGIFDSLPPQTRMEMIAMRRVATTDGIQRAFLWGAAFAILGLIVSTFLPLRPDSGLRTED
jgi:predicted MFS family arabinose efflux permease